METCAICKTDVPDGAAECPRCKLLSRVVPSFATRFTWVLIKIVAAVSLVPLGTFLLIMAAFAGGFPIALLPILGLFALLLWCLISCFSPGPPKPIVLVFAGIGVLFQLAVPHMWVEFWRILKQF